jgi:mRNA interferase MazF
MTVGRGDVVIVDWPLFRAPGKHPAKPRPALIVQNNTDNARLTNTIAAMITSVTRRSMEPTQLLIEIATPDGLTTGLRQDSVVNCVNLLTVEQSRILHVIGSLSGALMRQINDCLKAALELP